MPANYWLAILWLTKSSGLGRITGAPPRELARRRTFPSQCHSQLVQPLRRQCASTGASHRDHALRTGRRRSIVDSNTSSVQTLVLCWLYYRNSLGPSDGSGQCRQPLEDIHMPVWFTQPPASYRREHFDVIRNTKALPGTKTVPRRNGTDEFSPAAADDNATHH